MKLIVLACAEQELSEAVRNETILIADIMHLRQNPQPWLKRI